MTLEELGMALAVTSVVLGVSTIFKESRHLRDDLRRRYLYTKYGSLRLGDTSIDESRSAELRRQVDLVSSDLLDELPGYEFDELIAFLSGRLVFSIRGRGLRPLIVKTVLDERRMTRAQMCLFNEAVILGHLDGKRAPRVIKASFTARSNRPYVLRELLVGSSLDRVLIELAKNQLRPRFSDVHALLIDIASAVSEIHTYGVVHGDLKPANILGQWRSIGSGYLTITSEQPVQLLDFEAASILEAGFLTSLGGITRGTPFFMAPERYAQMRVNAATDVYSLSAIAALLLTGRPEAPGSSAGERIRSARIRAAIRRGMSVDVSERFSNVDDWISEVDAGFNDLIASRGDEEVDWPLDDPERLLSELADQAVSVSVGSLRRYARVAERVDLASIDAVVRARYRHLDRLTQDLVEAVWFDEMTIDAAADSLNLDRESAFNRLELFAAELASHVRHTAIQGQIGISK